LGAAQAAKPEGKETLQDIEMSAATVADQAEQLVQYSLSNQLSAQSHLIMLTSIVEDVNRMGREMATLEAEHDSLPKWEQRTSDKALPLLQETAANTKKAVEFADQNRSRLWSEDYRGYATAIWKDTEQMAKTIRDYLKYAPYTLLNLLTRPTSTHSTTKIFP
jgi:hypothetical protein